jgi:Fe-S cluster assembly protein SufD
LKRSFEAGMTTRTVKRRAKRSKNPEVAPEFRFKPADVEKLSKQLAEPSWLRKRRLSAWQTYVDTPMPTIRDEAWRRSDIRLLPSDQVELNLGQDVSTDRELGPTTEVDDAAHQLILRQGLPAESIGGDALAAQGVVFCDWATALRDHQELIRRHLGSVVRDDEGKFAALAAGLTQTGALVYVPSGIRVEKPVSIVMQADGSGSVMAARLLVVLDEGAEITIFHDLASAEQRNAEAIHAGIVELSVADEARLTFIELQNLGQHVWNFTHERAHLGRNASMIWILGSMGSRFTKSFIDLDLHGEGAEGRLSGFYVADGVQHLDHDTQQNHLAANTTSDLLFKGALTERSRSVWQGMIYVAPGAQRTDGYQVNRNLILSEDARADSIPGLEILADDVRCTHGASVGKLEEETLFYLMSRGVPREMAENLLIEGFFAPIIEQIPNKAVRTRLAGMIATKLSQ